MKISNLAFSILLLITITISKSNEIYIPTITGACINRTNGMYRLNMQWVFVESADLSEIDEFDIVTVTDGSVTTLYHYDKDDTDTSTDVITDGVTFANNIPLPGITSTTIEVRIATVVNRAVNSPSEPVTTTECSTADLNPTTTTTTTTTITTTTTNTNTNTITTVTTTIPSVAGNEESVLMTNLPASTSVASSSSSSTPLSTSSPLLSSSPTPSSSSSSSPTPNNSTNLTNMSSANDSDDFPIIVVVIAVAIICVVLLFVMIILIIFIVRLKYKSRKNKDSESEAESVKPLQNGSLLFRQADKVNYLKTPSQISDSRYNSARYQSDNTENAKNQSQRYSEAHKYDVPANNKAARNEYDHIDFQYEQAEHPFQQSHSNGAPHVAYYEEGPQPKYNVLVHSSSMDKLGKDCPNPPSITTDHYNKLHDNTPANTNQTHLKNGEVYYSVPVNIPSDANSSLSANNGKNIADPHDYDRLSEKP